MKSFKCDSIHSCALLLGTFMLCTMAHAQTDLESTAALCSMAPGAAITLSPNNPRIKILKDKGAGGPSIFVVANKFAVNTDGSPRSYHPLDPEGTKFALNKICHAAVLIFDGGQEVSCYKKPQSPRYYEIFRRFVAERNSYGAPNTGYDPESDTAYVTGDDFGLGLDEPRDERFAVPFEEPLAEPERRARGLDEDYVCESCRTGACEVCYTKNIIKMSGPPCVRDKGKYAGYFGNLLSIDSYATNDPDPENVDGANENNGCSHPIRIDAEKLPGVVLPGGKLVPANETYSARKGDIAIAYNTRSRNWAFTVVNDSGPNDDFGEGSIAANRILKNGYRAKVPRPKVYKDATSLHISNKVALLLLPGTKATLNGDYSPRAVAKAAKEAFEKWGGGDLVKARARFRSCLVALPESFPGEF